MKHVATLAIALLTTSAATTAFAADKVLAKSGSWTLTESATTCTASADTGFSVIGPKGALQIITKKGALQALEIMVQINGKDSNFAGVRLSTSDSYVNDLGTFLKAGSTTGGQYFWMVPRNTQGTINAIASATRRKRTNVRLHLRVWPKYSAK